jgi:hypothetical protein
MSDRVFMTVWFRPEVLPVEGGVQIKCIQEGLDHQPIAELDLGVWPLTIEAAIVLAEELAREQAEHWRQAMKLAVSEILNPQEQA